jgi:SOS-response transcriptional repressor LexA
MDDDDRFNLPMADWRKNLRRVMAEKGYNMKSLSLKAGLGESAVHKILSRSGDPQISTVKAIAKALEVTIDQLVFNVVSTSTSVKLTPVVGDVAAGVWMETDVWDDEKYEQIPILPSRYPGIDQKAWHVSGDSMDMLGISDDSFIVTVDYWAVRTSPTDGDVVVVERRRGGLVERTCKEVSVRTGEYELRPQSSDPRYQPIIVRPGNRNGDDGTEIEIIGLVVGSYRRIGR